MQGGLITGYLVSMSFAPFPFIPYGGDYNPEQWPREIWDRDIELMLEAGVNIATLPVFGWGNIWKAEDEWDFEWLDSVIAKLHGAGIRLCLATATAATPPWVDKAYPDILRTEYSGRKRGHGDRHTFCPHSSNFRRMSRLLAGKVAERYGRHPALLVWHVSNEYGNPCFCGACSAAFRTWLKERYGSLEQVNHCWNTAFWGQTFTDWSQIEAPTEVTQRNFQGLRIDYDRFQSDSILDCCKNEIEAIREHSQDIPITTNFMGAFKPLDYHRWAKVLDVVSWDSYPSRSSSPIDSSFKHSLTRGMKGGQPFMLMEQTPSTQNWQPYNSQKRPGVMRLWSYQAMAHGADSVMYFQWRRSPGAQEMFHGAVVEHAGRSDARVFREVAALGAELKKLGTKTLGARVEAPVAVLFGWENWWAVEYSSGPTVDLQYYPACLEVFESLSRLGINTDVLSPDADWSQHKVVIAPMLKMIKPGFAERVRTYVEGGGIYLTTTFSGVVDETDRAFSNGYPGPLADTLGIWVEEIDTLPPTETNAIRYGDQILTCNLLFDLIRLEGAESLGVFERDYYAGEPAITRNEVGKGFGYYVGSRISPEGWDAVLEDVADLAGIAMMPPPPGVEMVRRGDIIYYLNHQPIAIDVSLPPGTYGDLLTDLRCEGTLKLPGYGVALLVSIH